MLRPLATPAKHEGSCGHGEKTVEWAGKPNSVPRVSGWAIIYLGRRSPDGSCTLPAANEFRIRNSELLRRAASRRIFGLAGGGVYPATTVTSRAVRSYRTISPLPAGHEAATGGIFSVALSLGSRRVGVTNHRALPSSDFPPARLACRRSPSPTPPANMIALGWFRA